MNAVRLVERRDAGNACQEEGDQDQIVLPGEGGIHGSESAGIVPPQVRDHAHAREDHGDLVILQDADRLVDVLLRQARVDPPQAVVGAGFEDDDLGLELQYPLDAREGPAARLAADARVHDPPVVAGLLQLPLQQRGIGIFLVYALTRGEAVAHGCDGSLVGKRLLLRRLHGRFLFLAP